MDVGGAAMYIGGAAADAVGGAGGNAAVAVGGAVLVPVGASGKDLIGVASRNQVGCIRFTSERATTTVQATPVATNHRSPVFGCERREARARTEGNSGSPVLLDWSVALEVVPDRSNDTARRDWTLGADVGGRLSAKAWSASSCAMRSSARRSRELSPKS